MEPITHPSCNTLMQGEDCEDLPVTRTEYHDPPRPRVVTHTSFWKPSEEELEILKNGGSIKVEIWGGQPPLTVDVEPEAQLQ